MHHSVPPADCALETLQYVHNKPTTYTFTEQVQGTNIKMFQNRQPDRRTSIVIF